MTFVVLTLPISSLASHQTWSNCHLHYTLPLNEDLDLDNCHTNNFNQHGGSTATFALWFVNSKRKQHMCEFKELPEGKWFFTKMRQDLTYIWLVFGWGILQNLNIWIKDVFVFTAGNSRSESGTTTPPTHSWLDSNYLSLSRQNVLEVGWKLDSRYQMLQKINLKSKQRNYSRFHPCYHKRLFQNRAKCNQSALIFLLIISCFYWNWLF